MEAFSQNKISLKVALLPSESANPIDGIKQQLNKMLLKYSDELQGVPITFNEISFPPGKEHGRIIGERPWIHVDVSTTMLVFTPHLGLTLRGKINTMSDNYMSLLIYGMFNANISGDELEKQNYKYNHEDGKWESESDNNYDTESSSLAVGDMIECKISGYQQANGVLSLICTLV
jgi:DNA-directed RNA polymerase I subunit RPA43